MGEEPPAGPLDGLDPDAAAAARRGPTAAGGPAGAGRSDPIPPAPPPLPPTVDVRRHRWAVGIIGLAVVIVFSVVGLLSHRPTTTGVPAGGRLHWFAAPLADSDLRGDPNLHPPCTLARHDPRALNLCLDAGRAPVVLSLFVAQSRACVSQVDALQALASRFPAVRFLAVAVGTGHAAAARLVARHHWTIPVAYDADGAVGDEYGVVACPMAELASRGGIVRDRLIGDRWRTAAALAPRVEALAGPAR